MSSSSRAELERLAEVLQGSRRAVALTGAGVSTESGIPDFRSDAGMWRNADPERVASIQGFLSDPLGFYRFWIDKFAALVEAEPNVTHRVLAMLEQGGHLRSVVTQNIDGLHQKAGSERVHEVHGTFQRAVCLGCGTPYDIERIFEKVSAGESPSCDHCGDLVKPSVVLFGEMLPPVFEQGAKEAAEADTLLVLGSSLEVYPVAELVPQAQRAGAKLALVNRDPGPFDSRGDIVIHAELGETMEELERLIPC